MSEQDGTDARQVPLTTPIEAHGETLTSLTLRRPVLGDLSSMSFVVQPSPDDDEGASIKFSIGDTIPVIAKSAGIPLSSARRIAVADLGSIMGAMWDFLPKSLSTTGTS